MVLRKTLTAFAVAAIASVGALGLTAGDAEARHGYKHGHKHRHHRHWGWGHGWHPYPIYAGGYHGCTWVKRVRFVPGYGPVVRWKPVCYF